MLIIIISEQYLPVKNTYLLRTFMPEACARKKIYLVLFPEPKNDLNVCSHFYMSEGGCGATLIELSVKNPSGIRAVCSYE